MFVGRSTREHWTCLPEKCTTKQSLTCHESAHEHGLLTRFNEILTANRKKPKLLLFCVPFTGCGVLHLLGTDPDHTSSEVPKTLRDDNTHRVHSDHKPRTGLSQLVSQPFPLRISFGELSQGVQEGDVVRTGFVTLHPGKSRDQIDTHRHQAHRKWRSKCWYSVKYCDLIALAQHDRHVSFRLWRRASTLMFVLLSEGNF